MSCLSEVIPDHVVEFIQGMLPERTALMQRIEAECRAEYIPLVEPEVGQFLQVLLNIKKAVRILEIGTGIGYSSILLASSFGTLKGHITTIEIDRDRYARACDNIREAGLAELITPLCGDANEVIPSLVGTFDFVFMDAAKGQYPEFFLKFWPYLEPGGLIVIDNIFLNGWVIDMTWPERRKKTMVCRVRELLEMLKKHEGLLTSIMPLGDGLAVSVRR